MSGEKIDLEGMRERAARVTTRERNGGVSYGYEGLLAADVLALAAEVERLREALSFAKAEADNAIQYHERTMGLIFDACVRAGVPNDTPRALAAIGVANALIDAKAEIEVLKCPTADGLCAVCGRDPSPDSRRDNDGAIMD